MDAQFTGVRLEDPVLEIAGAKVKKDVDEVQEVGEVIEAEPDRARVQVDLLKGKPIDDDPEIVEEGHGHDHGPVVAEAAGRIEHERPLGVRTQPRRGRATRAACESTNTS